MIGKLVIGTLLTLAALLGAAPAQADQVVRTGESVSQCLYQPASCGPNLHSECREHRRRGEVDTGSWCNDPLFLGNPMCNPGNSGSDHVGYACTWERYAPGAWRRDAAGQWVWTADAGHWEKRQTRVKTCNKQWLNIPCTSTRLGYAWVPANPAD